MSRCAVNGCSVGAPRVLGCRQRLPPPHRPAADSEFFDDVVRPANNELRASTGRYMGNSSSLTRVARIYTGLAAVRSSSETDSSWRLPSLPELAARAGRNIRVKDFGSNVPELVTYHKLQGGSGTHESGSRRRLGAGPTYSPTSPCHSSLAQQAPTLHETPAG